MTELVFVHHLISYFAIFFARSKLLPMTLNEICYLCYMTTINDTNGKRALKIIILPDRLKILKTF